jgi:hypothetical protein
MPSFSRICLASLTAAFLLCTPVIAFNTPLSDQAVREAYFLGQRRDESMARLLNRYTKLLPRPETGPHIYGVTFLTPFALLVRHSSEQPNYSAQQAARDHDPDKEIVVIEIQIFLTQSYGAVIPARTSPRSDSPVGYQLRPSDFWKTFKYRVFDDKDELIADDLSGEPIYVCEGEGGCDLSGATVRIQFPATAFKSDAANIDITPPEGDPVSVDLDLASLR